MKAYTPQLDPGMVLAKATVRTSSVLGPKGAALSKVSGLLDGMRART